MITLLMTLIGDDPKEKERFEQFFYKYERKAYYRAYSFMKDEQDALDVLQEAFISIAKNFYKIKDIDSKETRNYIMTIVENRARKELLKSQKRHEAEKALIEKWKLDQIESKKKDVFSEVDLIDLIFTMPEIYSGPLYLFYIQRLTVNEIADSLGISGVAVRKRLERARSMLREMIGVNNE